MKKVLFVDDTLFEMGGECLRNMFYKVGIYTEFVSSAEASVHMLKHMQYDVVLMDATFLMNKLGEDRIYASMQGLEAVELIRKFSAVPIIMISAEGEARKKGMALGANASVDKNDWDGMVTKCQEIINREEK